MKKQEAINIRIKEINQCTFNLNQKTLPKDEIEIGKNLSIGLGFNFNVDFENNLFHFFTLITYKNHNTDESVIELETEIIFELNDLKLVVKKQKTPGDFNINDDLIITLAGVAIGTSRGVLASNTKGTPLSKFPLPILNPKEIIGNYNKPNT
jgi:hypothetical protein